MEEPNVVEKTMEKIKKEHLAPKPGWKFSALNVLEWFLWAVLAIIGAMVMLVIFNLFWGIEWDIRRNMQWGIFRILFSSLPPLWLVLLVIALALAFFGLRLTKYGYRYSASRIMALTLLSILGISFFSYLTKIDESMYQMMRNFFPGEENVFGAKEKIWLQPEKGLLAGVVVSFSPEENKMIVEDLGEEEWEVILDQEVRIPKRLGDDLINQKVKFLGEKADKNTFQAREIRPWMRPGERMHGEETMGGKMMKNRQSDHLENKKEAERTKD